MFNKKFIALFVLLLLLISACQGAEPTVSEPAEEAPAEAAEEGAEIAEKAEVVEEEAEAMEEEAEIAEMRTITDAMGREVSIPVDPQRIVVMSEIDLDSLLALGVTPVGAPNGRGQQTLPTYMLPLIEGKTTSIGGLGEPNLETVLNLEPDLIVYSDPWGALAERIPEMEEIAPVVVPYVDEGDWHWKSVFTAVADVLDKSAEADAWFEGYVAQTAAIGEQLSDEVREVSIVRWMGDGPRILLSNAFSSDVLSDVGFIRPDYQLDLAGSHPVHTDVINMEQIEVVDADIVFAGGLNPEGDTAMQEALENPLVQSFSSVQNGHLFTVDGLAWSSTGGPTAALVVLADVEDALGQAAGAMDQGEMVAMETRLVTHAYGEIEVPASPQRIVALDEGTMTDLIALGITPAGVHDWGNRDFALFLNVDPATIPSVGTPDGPNFEAMLNLEPDLIIGRTEELEWYPEEMRESLEAIGTTVFSPNPSADWQSHLAFLGEVVNKEAEASALLEVYDTRLEEFKAAWEASGNNETIAIIRSRADAFNIYNKESFIAETAKSAGLTMPESFDEMEAWNTISVEQIDMVTADNLFVMARNEDEAQAFVDMVNGPLWQVIPAVAKDQAYQVNWSVWVAGWNSVGAQLVLDDFFFFLLDSQPSTPNPLEYLLVDGFGPQFDVVRFGGEALPTPSETAAAIGGECEAGFRPFEHFAGITCVPEEPQRVVTLQDQNALLPLWELDFRNIAGSAGRLNDDGSFYYRRMQGFDTSGIEFVGSYGEPNLETILTLQPDLIVGNQFLIDNYDLYSEIAPTVLIEVLTQPLEDSSANFAALVGREAELAELQEAYEARVVELREAIGEPSEITVSLIQWGAGGGAEPGQFYVEEGGAVITVLNDLGFDRPANQIGVPERTFYSLELLPEHDGDVILRPYFTPEEIDNDEASVFKDSPIWGQLNAVQKGQAFDVPGDQWFGAAYTPRFRALDALEALLVDQEIDTSWEAVE